MRIPILLLMMFSATLGHAQEQRYVRDYTYKASDLDSKVSARNNALKLIKAGVLEEIVSYVYSSNSLELTQSGEAFRTAFIQNTSSSSAGFVRARIVDESWDGFEMKIKAEVTADPVQIRKELERSLALKTEAPAAEERPQASQPPAGAGQTAAPPPDTAAGPPYPGAPAPSIMPFATTTPDYSGYVRTSQLVEVYSLLQPLKITMTEYYMMNGKWPSSLAQINLKPEEMTDGQYLEKVRLGKQGRIFAYLSETFGKDKLLSLAPRSIMGGMQTRWDCTTNVNTRGMVGFETLKCKEDRRLRYN